MSLDVSAKQRACQPMHELWYRRRHRVDRRARGAKAHGGGDSKDVNVRDPRCWSRDALDQRVVVSEVGKAGKARALRIRRWLVAVGPGRDVGGTVSQLAPACKIHVDAGAADREIHREYALRRLQFDVAADLSGGLDRRAVIQVKIGVAGTAIVGRLRKTFPH